jgi:hypothetical protein
MRDRGRELSLAQEARAILGTGEAAVQDFERDAPPVSPMLGLVDLAHTASAQQPADEVRTERLARCQPRLPGVHCAGARGLGARGLKTPASSSEGRQFVAGQMRAGRSDGGHETRRAQPVAAIRRQFGAALATAGKLGGVFHKGMSSSLNSL